MRKYHSFFLIATVSILIIPSVVFAAWWNPFTWFKKKTIEPKIDQLTDYIQTPVEEAGSILEKKPIEIKSQLEPNQKIKTTIDTDLISEVDSWEEYSVVQGGIVRVPPYTERIIRTKQVCDYINYTIKPLSLNYLRYPPCSIGASTTLTVKTDIEIGIDYLSYMQNTKRSKKMTMNAWNLILDFEKAKISIFEPRRQLEAEKLREQARREIQQRQQASQQFYPSTDYFNQNNNNQVPGPNCSAYASEKDALDSSFARSGTLHSSARRNAMSALDAKYAKCF